MKIGSCSQIPIAPKPSTSAVVKISMGGMRFSIRIDMMTAALAASM